MAGRWGFQRRGRGTSRLSFPETMPECQHAPCSSEAAQAALLLAGCRTAGLGPAEPPSHPGRASPVAFRITAGEQLQAELASAARVAGGRSALPLDTRADGCRPSLAPHLPGPLCVFSQLAGLAGKDGGMLRTGNVELLLVCSPQNWRCSTSAPALNSPCPGLLLQRSSSALFLAQPTQTTKY